MSTYASLFTQREYHNRKPDHLLFQQRCRARYSKALLSSSTSSTRPKLQPHSVPSTISSESLSTLLELLNHRYLLQSVDEQLAVPSSIPCRPIRAFTTSCRLKQSHKIASARPSPRRIITVDIDEMSSLGKKPSFGQPSVEFHMNTRRRASQTSSQGCCSSSSSGSNSSPTFKANTIAPATPEDFFPRQTTPEQTEMPPPKTPSPRRDITQPSVSPRQAVNSARFMTPVHASPMSSPDSSPLSSAPTDLGSSPEGFVNSTRAVKRKTRQRSPTPKTHTTKKIILSPINYGNLTPERQSYLKRKAGSSDSYVEEDDGLNACPGEWSKTPAPEKRSIWNSTFREGRTAFETKQQQRKKVSFAPSTSSSPVKTGLKLLAKPALGLTKPSSAERDEPQETNGVNERFWSSQGSNEDAAPADQPDRKPGPKKKTKDQLDLEVNVQRHEEWVEVNIFGHEDKKNPIFYAADGVTQYASPAESSPAKNGRGGANTGGGVKKRRGGGGWNKGIGRGKGKGKGRGRGNRRDEEEDPFEGKDPASDDHKTFIKAMRARQGQLRHLYKEVGRHQVDVLDTLSLRDINRLVRRANAHKKVPEYEEVLEELEDRKEDAVEFAKRQLEIERKLAEDQFAKQQELIEQRFAQHVKQTRQEHLFGAQGDIMLLEKQKAAVIDDDRTDDGSHNQDAEYFPRYHQFPESNEQARGYTSDRITDERPFKAQLSTFNYDDQVRREVLQTDIMEPVIRAIEKSNTARREAESREKTQNMMALSNEAISQLSEVKGYLVPTRMTSTELNSYSLSLLADISEYHAERFKDKAYRYLPLAPGETFPKEYLELEQLPGTRGPPRRQHPPFPRTPSVPNPRTHQFVFQNPGIPRNPPARAAPATPTARVQQRFPVQFVNQTIESRKAAGNAGKGGQRMLLPKV